MIWKWYNNNCTIWLLWALNTMIYDISPIPSISQCNLTEARCCSCSSSWSFSTSCSNSCVSCGGCGGRGSSGSGGSSSGGGNTACDTAFGTTHPESPSPGGELKGCFHTLTGAPSPHELCHCLTPPWPGGSYKQCTHRQSDALAKQTHTLPIMDKLHGCQPLR